MNKMPKSTEKRFTENGILTLKATLQKRYRLHLCLHHLNNIQVFLMCEESSKTKCSFTYIFRKRNGDPREQEYVLLVSNFEHSSECTQKRKHLDLTTDTKTGQKGEQSLHEQDSNEKQDQEVLHNQSMQIDPRHNPESPSEKEKRHSHYLSVQIDSEEGDLQGQYFREEQLTALKKTLVHRYSALVSKSTYIDPTLKVVTKICFRCKNAQRFNCPFLQELNLVPESQTSPLYQLDSKNSSHTQDCLMDYQDLRYHEMTKKIDDSMEIIDRIVRNLAEGNQQGVRPKLVLQTLAQELGEDSGDFIYSGLERRNNRRAIKKYFDNAVGKIRSKQKYEL